VRIEQQPDVGTVQFSLLRGDVGPPVRKGQIIVLRAALATFAEHGYQRASMREVARKAGISPGGIYHYYASKHDLLLAIVEDVVNGIIGDVRAALKLTRGADARVRLQAAIRAFISFYITHQTECAVVDSERRYLDEAGLKMHIAQRRELQGLFDEVIEYGIEQGQFRSRNIRVISRVIMVFCRDVAVWYRPDGPLGPDEIADEYADMALRLLAVS